MQEAMSLEGLKIVDHVVFILCDGMGSAILEKHLQHDDFLRKNNEADRLKSVFPATTPAALTTLATGVWPGRHGAAGWELRDQIRCEYPEECVQPVQIRVLHKRLWDMRSNKPLAEHGFTNAERDVFFARSWSAAGQTALLQHSSKEEPAFKRQKVEDASSAHYFVDAPRTEVCNSVGSDSIQCRTVVPVRSMLFVNAYVGSDFTNYAQGDQVGHQVGLSSSSSVASAVSNCVTCEHAFRLEGIGETAVETLATPEGPEQAIAYFRKGCQHVLKHIRGEVKGSREGTNMARRRRTYSYLYTAHPDKHMHELGVEAAAIGEIIRGLNGSIAQLYADLQSYCLEAQTSVSLFVTADHGHATIPSEAQIILPSDVEQCLEYACVGATGKGRHAYLRVRSGLSGLFEKAWFAHAQLHKHFLLFRTDDAVDLGLFGPCDIDFSNKVDKSRTVDYSWGSGGGVDPRVRPRLGDYVVLSLGAHTLVTPREAAAEKLVGGHGSLTPDEVRIPFILLKA